MVKYIVKRIVYMALVMLVVTSITFFLLHAIPGDPITAMVQDLPEETRQAYLAAYGFDRPVGEQYLLYLRRLFSGDLGSSLRYPGRKVADIVANYSPVSALVGGVALLIGGGLGLGCGVLAALKRDRWPDRVIMVLSLLGTTIPTFVIASVLQYALTVTWPVFPTTGYEGARWLVLPVLCMCVGPLATYARYMRSSMLDTVNQDYILTAEAKGLSEWRVVTKHMLRNALLPCVTMLCVSVAGIFSGSFIVESIFSLPGLGRYFISAISDRDYFVVLGLNVVLTGVYVCAIRVSMISVVLDSKSAGTLVFALTVTGWCPTARIVRSQMLRISQSDYVLAARLMDISPARIVLRHLIPNAMSVIIVDTTFRIPGFIFSEAFLSYVGLGIQPPQTSWGALAAASQGMFRFYPWQLLFPAGMIALTMLSFTLLGDGLRDALDPRLRR